VGPLEWHVTELKSAPALEPFRVAFRESCAGLSGLAAATCVSVSLAKHFRNGEPRDEFFGPLFNPTDHLRRHLAGEPGHCVTRSAILATELLAVGIPARVIQLVPPDGKGHTLVEVWDDELEWLLVDPTFGGSPGLPLGRRSAVELQATPESVTWYGIPKESSSAKASEPLEFMREAFKGNLIYPDPWLYLREGSGPSVWPWRGRFVRVGPVDWRLGPAQMGLQLGVLASSLAGAVLAAIGLLRWLLELRSQEPSHGDYPVFVARDLDGIPPA
jgi:hypothetical protein